VSDSDLEATLEKELVRARLDVELFQKRRPVRLGRFEVLRCIGRGSLGVVYEARDTDHGGRVALKLLRRVDGRTISQFKHEFRVLSGLTHVNLVSLHELVCERDRWFVSMELIEGVPFDRWLSGDPGAPLAELRLRNALAQLVRAVSVIHRSGKLHRDLKPSNVLVTADGRLVVLDYGLVSTAYAQTHGGPLVAPSELGSARGLALSDSSQWRQGSALRASPPVLIGTPGYMAPEQAGREPAQEASDWYAVGVMLFEVLAHRLPFGGSTRAVLRDKRVRAAPRVRELNPRVTHALDRLCRRLLERDPALRGGAADIEAWLGRQSLAAPRSSSRAGRVPAAPVQLEGRERDLQLLASAFECAPREAGARVWVSGAPGIGKTALLDAFAASVAPGALVLRGRCHEEESIPLKLFDAIADALCEACAGTKVELPELALKERAALLAAFPVLGELPGLGPVQSASVELEAGQSAGRELGELSETERETIPMRDREVAGDANTIAPTVAPAPAPVPAAHVAVPEERELAVTLDAADVARASERDEAPRAGPASHDSACAALSCLLRGLAARQPIVILLDDLQWADAESARQFERVFRGPDAPAVLFVGAFRREEGGSGGFVEAGESRAEDGFTQLIELGPLAPDAAITLACTLLREQGVPATFELCRKLATDTWGIPFLMTELVQQVKRPRRSSAFVRSSTGAIALATAIRARVNALPAGARRLLAVLCVANAPLALRPALSAAKLPIDEHIALTLLCRTRLARSRGGRPIETLEPYHECVRESVLLALSPDERRELAAEIALAAGGCSA
jgi:serine/threonine protein kinase